MLNSRRFSTTRASCRTSHRHAGSLGLARAYVLTGDTPKAKAAYQDFFALWKDADPDIPILRQAREEYAPLQ